MPDVSGNLITSDQVSRYSYTASSNTRLSDYYDTQLDWSTAIRPSVNFPLSLLDSPNFTQMNIGDIPANSPSGAVHHEDIGPALQTFCEQFTLIRNCNYIEYITTSDYPVGNGDIETLNETGYTRFVDNPSAPGGSYTYNDGGVTVTTQTITEDPANHNIDVEDPINTGNPYTPTGFNDFVTAIRSEIQSDAIDQVVTITYTYCHDQCHSSCYTQCSHTY